MRDSHEPVGLKGRALPGGVLPVGALRGKASARPVRKGDPDCDPLRRTPPEPPFPTPQERILQAVSERYGITYVEIFRRTGLANGVVDYHLGVLLKESRLWKVTYEGRSHFFASRQATESLIALTKAERIALMLPRDRSVTVEGAGARLKVPPSTMRRHLAVLEGEGLVCETKVGRVKRYWIKDPERLDHLIEARIAGARER